MQVARFLGVLQLGLACVSVGGGTLFVLLWLAALPLHWSHPGLMPWTAAGLLAGGPALVACGAVVALPGLLLAQRLSGRAPAQGAGMAKALVRGGCAVLALGLAASLALVVGVRPAPDDPPRIIHRDPLASPLPGAAASGP